MYAKSERRLICIKLQRLTIRVLILDNSEKKTNTEKKKKQSIWISIIIQSSDLARVYDYCCSLANQITDTFRIKTRRNTS